MPVATALPIPLDDAMSKRGPIVRVPGGDDRADLEIDDIGPRGLSYGHPTRYARR
jgi:hypothetical protein